MNMTNISTHDVRDVAGWYQEGAGWILFGTWGHIHTALHDALSTRYCMCARYCMCVPRLFSFYVENAPHCDV